MSNETKRRLLLSKWNGFDRIASMQEQIDAKEAALANMTWERDDLESVLLDVRYWLLDGLVHHKLVSDPRALLRKVEGVL